MKTIYNTLEENKYVFLHEIFSNLNFNFLNNNIVNHYNNTVWIKSFH